MPGAPAETGMDAVTPEQRAERRAAGLCTKGYAECTGAVEPGRATCSACRARVIAFREQRRADGHCSGCLHRLAEPGTATCEVCRPRKIAEQRARDEEKRRAGLCLQWHCRRPAAGGLRCEECLARARENAILRYREKGMPPRKWRPPWRPGMCRKCHAVEASPGRRWCRPCRVNDGQRKRARKVRAGIHNLRMLLLLLAWVDGTRTGEIALGRRGRRPGRDMAKRCRSELERLSTAVNKNPPPHSGIAV